MGTGDLPVPLEGVDWPSGGSYDEGFSDTEVPRFPQRKAML